MPRAGEPDNIVSMARLRGKVVETGQDVHIDAPRRRKRRKGWREKVALLDLTNLNRLDLSALEYRVLFAMMEAVPEKGGRDAFITLREVAEKVGSTNPSVSRCVKDLRERNILFKRDGHVGRYSINAWLMFNGDFDSWSSEASEDAEPIWVRGADTATGEVK